MTMGHSHCWFQIMHWFWACLYYLTKLEQSIISNALTRDAPLFAITPVMELPQWLMSYDITRLDGIGSLSKCFLLTCNLLGIELGNLEACDVLHNQAGGARYESSMITRIPSSSPCHDHYRCVSCCVRENSHISMTTVIKELKFSDVMHWHHTSYAKCTSTRDVSNVNFEFGLQTSEILHCPHKTS